MSQLTKIVNWCLLFGALVLAGCGESRTTPPPPQVSELEAYEKEQAAIRAGATEGVGKDDGF